jgi:hypothetical protein
MQQFKVKDGYSLPFLGCISAAQKAEKNLTPLDKPLS